MGNVSFTVITGWSDNKLYNGFKKPLARLVSNEIISTDSVSPDSTYTHMLMQWGQFLDHDLDHSLPSLSIESFGERVSCRRYDDDAWRFITCFFYHGSGC